MPIDPLIISCLIFLVATLYSMVGHGGASGYLAVLSIFAVPQIVMSSTSLVLNLFVAGISFTLYALARHFRWSLTWPFLVSAVPFAFLGALFKLPASVYSALLAIALLYAAFRLLRSAQDDPDEHELPLKYALLSGSLIGLISGILGIGGGIFLSPVLLIFKWGNPKETAATSAVFIFVNSLAGLSGRFFSGNSVSNFPSPCDRSLSVGAILGSFMGQ
ncbi:MAG: sulfite exporter TauE/SafE family protein [Fimbriimonadaceae bacterium]